MAEDALAAVAAEPIEWASAKRALDDAAGSGDRHVVADRPGGVLLAVIDGLGHGAQAAAAAQAAATTVERYAAEALDRILHRCHDTSLDTRGSAITLATIDQEAGTLVWAGVGNVAGVVLSSDPSPNSRLIRGSAGIVGSRLPKLHTETLTLSDGDVILLASDGIRPDFADVLMLKRPLQRVVDQILAASAVPSDDALVLAARYHRTHA